MEIATPQAGHVWILLFLGFAEPGPGRGFAFFFGLAGCRFLGTVFVRPVVDLTDHTGERLGFGRPRASQQALTSLPVEWVRPQ